MTTNQSKFPQSYMAEPGQSDRNVVVVDTDITLTAEDHRKRFAVGTDALTITLPSAVVGLEYRFTNIGADGNNIITISPQSADKIWGTITLASSVVDLGGAAGKDLINTKSTSIKGDSVHLVCLTEGEWFVASSTGIWAAEA